MWRDAADEWGEPLFQQAGCIWFARREDGFEAASEMTLRRLEIPVERLTPADVTARWPQIDASDLVFAIHEPEAARRCFGDGDPAFERYHDQEWGFPVLDERGLFERGCIVRRAFAKQRPARKRRH